MRVETHDVLIQHITIRVGAEPGSISAEDRDAIAVGSSKEEVHHVVLDHLSLSWAIDENFSTAYPTTHDVTLSNSIIAEGLDNSIHPKGPHSKGILIGDGSERITVVRNIVAHNIERNPYLKPGTSVEFINNLVYGWGPKGGWSQCNLSDNGDTDIAVLLSFIGNYYKPGPDSFRGHPVYAKKIAAGTRIYVRDNIGPSSVSSIPDIDEEGWGISALPSDPYQATSSPIPSSGVEPIPARDVLDMVTKESGARPGERSGVDQRIVDHVRGGTGKIVDCVGGCTNAAEGWPVIQTVEQTALVPLNPFSDDNGDGYTNLEEWLNTRSRDVSNGEDHRSIDNNMLLIK